MPYNPGTVGWLRKYALSQLSGLDSPALEADYILEHFLGQNRPWIHAHPDAPVQDAARHAVMEACRRRQAREPLQYILGQCDFCGMSVRVDEGCLVPRPETELLVEAASDVFDGGTFLDWGTGTGCIALALLERFEGARAVMAEKNPKSLRCAWRNLKGRGLLNRALLWHSQTVSDIPACSVSLVVSNPPYIPSRQIAGLMPEVSQYEPRLALDGGADGLDPYPGLFELASRVLTPGGCLCVEYGGNEQTEPLKNLAPSSFSVQSVLRDIAGHDRVLVWRFTGGLK
ncbi:MAG: peptide chain release factor N(5)-glutamine methyltransferase [Pyramidobacter sp.]|nr:peptide chain release factor N(5)-glutamine methyltransferase [Pyramidobacter sp.]